MVRTSFNRRYGCLRYKIWRRIRVGLQKLRRRRLIRHSGLRLRIAGSDDVGAVRPRRHCRSRSCPRNSHQTLPRTPEREKHQHQLHRLHFRLDQRPRPQSKTRRKPRVEEVLWSFGKNCRWYSWRRSHDQGFGHQYLWKQSW